MLYSNEFPCYTQTFQAIPENIRKLAVLLMVLQLIDGFFTALGVTVFGVASEGNQFLRTIMPYLGPTMTLLLVKSTCILLIAFLATQAHKLRLIKPFLGLAIFVYFFGGILPWASIIGNFLAFTI